MLKSLGVVTVTTGGTPVQVSATNIYTQTIVIQQLQANTGKIYICDRATAVKATGVGVLYVLPKPVLNSGVAETLPSLTIVGPSPANKLDVSELWIDADVNGEGCLISILLS